MVLAIALCGCNPVRGASDKLSENSFSVMTYNIWDLGGRWPTVKKVVEVIRSSGVPDLILLQEVRGEKMAAAISRALGLLHHLYLGFQGRDFGVAIISRYELRNSGFLYFKASRKGYGALRADVTVNDQKIQVYSVHLDRIDSIKTNGDRVEISWGDALTLLNKEIFEETVRSQSAVELLDWIGSGGPRSAIIGGDFNTVLYSKAIRRMEAVFEDVLWASPDYFTGSYLRSTLPVDPRLDFLFYPKDLECLEACVVKQTAGDHYPVRAVFDFM